MRIFRLGYVLGAAVLVLLMVPALVAQCNGTICQGDNAVYSGNTQVQSHSFIDASEITGTGGDVCMAINTALQQLVNNPNYYGNVNGVTVGGVIDARAMTNPGNIIPCMTDPFATWSGWTGSYPSVTILLPPGVIGVHKTWYVPAFTRVIGQGACIPGSGATTCSTLTVLQAAEGTSIPWMIRMGSDGMNPDGSADGECPGAPVGEPSCKGGQGYANCNGVKIEHLVLDGNSIASGGILNKYSEELSWVNDVAMINLLGTGLELSVGIGNGKIDGDADNSGPYSNLYISTAGACVTLQGIVQGTTLKALNQTRGIHGLTCNTQLTTGAAISVDHSLNNTIEDVSITGPNNSQLDGIALGVQSGGDATGNLISNLVGTNLANVIHIAPFANNTTIVGVSNTTNNTNTIEDQLYGGLSLKDQWIGLYVAGDAVGGGTSRFTTSNSIPTWLFGTQTPTTGSCGSSMFGDLYSNTSAGSGVTALWACTPSGWSAISSQ